MSDTATSEAKPQHPLLEKLASLTPQQLELRRREIAESAKGDYEVLSTEALQELAFITQTLRRRSAGPPKTAKPAKAKPTIDGLLDF